MDFMASIIMARSSAEKSENSRLMESVNSSMVGGFGYFTGKD
jgi:hypothetical protein